MTEQEIVNKVCTHLVRQGHRSIHEDQCDFGVCAYRGEENRKCPVGCLIPDDKYTNSIEGVGIPELIALPTDLDDIDHANPDELQAALLLGILKELGLDVHLDLLSELQTAHDTSGIHDSEDSFLDDLKEQITEICTSHKLTVPQCLTEAK